MIDDDDGDSLVLYTTTPQEYNQFDLCKVKVYDYAKLTEEADRLLNGYESSDEIRERYKMLK